MLRLSTEDNTEGNQGPLGEGDLKNMVVHKPPPGKGPVDCINVWNYEMIGHTAQSVERYCDLAKVKIESL